MRGVETAIFRLYRDVLVRCQEGGAVRRAHLATSAFSILGQINWLYHWYKPDGGLSTGELADEVVIMKDGLVVHHADLEAERHSNRRFVELEVSGNDLNLAATLQQHGADGVSEGGGRWRIVLPLDFEIAGLWKVLAAEGLDVRKLTHRRDTLEEIFLKAVGHIRQTPGETAAQEEVSAHGSL